MPAREGAIPTKYKILDAAEKTIFHFTDRIFIASLKYFSELSIHSVSKKKLITLILSFVVLECAFLCTYYFIFFNI